MPKVTTRDKVMDLFQPDENGESNWVSVSRFTKAGLAWTNNGNLRRGVAFRMSDVTWEVKRVGGPRSEVTALRMAGWCDVESFSQNINGAIKAKFSDVNFCNLSLLPIPEPDREIDHRYGFKSHPDYVNLYATQNQKFSDFQLIHRVLNQQKRELCRKCVENEKRPPHPTLGYAEGDETLAQNNPCSGCFLAEPEKFRRT